jgi:hypothetical protein
LLFHCSENRQFGRKPLKLLARRRESGLDFFKNSLLIPLLPQIAKRFQRGAAGRGVEDQGAGSGRITAA